MLTWAATFFCLSILSGVLGLTGIASGAMVISRVLFVLFLVLCVIFLALSLASKER